MKAYRGMKLKVHEL